MRIAVTSASGQLGAAIVRALQVENADVVGLARTPAKAEHLGIEIRPGDYEDRAQLERSLAGVETVLLASGMAAPDQRIVQHRNVIEAAKAAGARKLVYTSIFGKDGDFGFTPIVNTNRQTEADLAASGLDFAIGRNGLYIEPDLEYIDTYKREGRIANCAGEGRCAYTTRGELAHAYARLLTNDSTNGGTYTLAGEAITQARLAEYLSRAAGVELAYAPMSVADYLAERSAELGDYLGPIIGGIYEGIAQGAMDVPSDYAAAAGREHVAWDDYFAGLSL